MSRHPNSTEPRGSQAIWADTTGARPCFGLLLLVLVNFVATQYIAAQFQYQPRSGDAAAQHEDRGHLSTLRLGHLGMAQLDIAGPACSEAVVYRRNDGVRWRLLRMRWHLLRDGESPLAQADGERRRPARLRALGQ